MSNFGLMSATGQPTGGLLGSGTGLLGTSNTGLVNSGGGFGNFGAGGLGSNTTQGGVGPGMMAGDQGGMANSGGGLLGMRQNPMNGQAGTLNTFGGSPGAFGTTTATWGTHGLNANTQYTDKSGVTVVNVNTQINPERRLSNSFLRKIDFSDNISPQLQQRLNEYAAREVNPKSTTGTVTSGNMPLSTFGLNSTNAGAGGFNTGTTGSTIPGSGSTNSLISSAGGGTSAFSGGSVLGGFGVSHNSGAVSSGFNTGTGALGSTGLAGAPSSGFGSMTTGFGDSNRLNNLNSTSLFGSSANNAGNTTFGATSTTFGTTNTGSVAGNGALMTTGGTKLGNSAFGSMGGQNLSGSSAQPSLGVTKPSTTAFGASSSGGTGFTGGSTGSGMFGTSSTSNISQSTGTGLTSASPFGNTGAGTSLFGNNGAVTSGFGSTGTGTSAFGNASAGGTGFGSTGTSTLYGSSNNQQPGSAFSFGCTSSNPTSLVSGSSTGNQSGFGFNSTGFNSGSGFNTGSSLPTQIAGFNGQSMNQQAGMNALLACSGPKVSDPYNLGKNIFFDTLINLYDGLDVSTVQFDSTLAIPSADPNLKSFADYFSNRLSNQFAGNGFSLANGSRDSEVRFLRKISIHPSDHPAIPMEETTAPPEMLPICTRPDYTCHPSIEVLQQYSADQLAKVQDFKVVRAGYGEIHWPGYTDLRSVNIDTCVDIQKDFAEVYGTLYAKANQNSAEDCRVPVGKGLNRPARITVYSVSPSPALSRKFANPEQLYEAFLAYVLDFCKSNKVNHLSLTKDYCWTFAVDHFSRYNFPTGVELSALAEYRPIADSKLQQIRSDFSNFCLNQDNENVSGKEVYVEPESPETRVIPDWNAIVRSAHWAIQPETLATERTRLDTLEQDAKSFNMSLCGGVLDVLAQEMLSGPNVQLTTKLVGLNLQKLLDCYVPIEFSRPVELLHSLASDCNSMEAVSLWLRSYVRSAIRHGSLVDHAMSPVALAIALHLGGSPAEAAACIADAYPRVAISLVSANAGSTDFSQHLRRGDDEIHILLDLMSGEIGVGFLKMFNDWPILLLALLNFKFASEYIGLSKNSHHIHEIISTALTSTEKLLKKYNPDLYTSMKESDCYTILSSYFTRGSSFCGYKTPLFAWLGYLVKFLRDSQVPQIALSEYIKLVPSDLNLMFSTYLATILRNSKNILPKTFENLLFLANFCSKLPESEMRDCLKKILQYDQSCSALAPIAYSYLCFSNAEAELLKRCRYTAFAGFCNRDESFKANLTPWTAHYFNFGAPLMDYNLLLDSLNILCSDNYIQRAASLIVRCLETPFRNPKNLIPILAEELPYELVSIFHIIGSAYSICQCNMLIRDQKMLPDSLDQKYIDTFDQNMFGLYYDITDIAFIYLLALRKRYDSAGTNIFPTHHSITNSAESLLTELQQNKIPNYIEKYRNSDTELSKSFVRMLHTLSTI